MKRPKKRKVIPVSTEVASKNGKFEEPLHQDHLRYRSLDSDYVQNRFKENHHKFYYPDGSSSIREHVLELLEMTAVPHTALEKANSVAAKDRSRMNCSSKSTMKFGALYILGLAAFMSLGLLSVSFSDIPKTEANNIMWGIIVYLFVYYNAGFLFRWYIVS